MGNFKFPSIKEPYSNESIVDKNIYVFEKVDGANVSIRKDNKNNVVGWSRGAPIGHSKKYYFNNFRRFLYESLNPQIYDLPENIIIFGEFTHNGYGHIIYDKENINKFFMIGMYDQDESKFLHPEISQEWLELMDLDKKIQSVPLFAKGKVNPSLIKKFLKQSKLYSGVPEGVVIHQYSDEFQHGLRFSKIYHPDFNEIDPKKKGVGKYITRRRFIKVAQNSISTSNGSFKANRIIEDTIEDIVKDTNLTKSELQNLRRMLYNKAGYIRDEIIPLFNGKENFFV